MAQYISPRWISWANRKRSITSCVPGFEHGQRDGFDKTTGAHGAVDAAGFGMQVVPVISYRAHPPGGAAEGLGAVMEEVIDIDFAT